MKKNILVFPCGSEIALEIHRALLHSAHFHLIGASSVNDHGKFVFEDYVDGLPFITDENFIPEIKRIVSEKKINAIYPAMDAVIEILKTHENEIACKVIAPELETTRICLSKSKTYKQLETVVHTPKLYTQEEIENKEKLPYPVFAKPDIGYGSRGASIIHSETELEAHLQKNPACIVLEYLPGEEFTVDCFTDKTGKLLCAKPRKRARIMNGISVNTMPVKENLDLFLQMANAINKKIQFRGAWFFQVKKDADGILTLLEIASRFGGSSSLFRASGINFALMTLFDAFDIPVSVLENHYEIEMDRALDNKYRINLDYNEVFVDFDDCIYLDKKFVNDSLIAFLFRARNQGKKITLLSRHDDERLGSLDSLLDTLRIKPVFDRIIHVPVADKKINYIDNLNAIFIDDSFAERKAIALKFGMNVFSLDMVECL